MKLTKEIKTAFIVIAGIACFFIGFNFLKSKSVFKRTNTYYAVFDHSGGLKSGTQVTVNGVQIGVVESVKIEEKTTKIKITLSCSRDFTFSKNSKVELYNSLLGGAGLQIVPAFDNAPEAQSGDTLQSSIQMDMLQALSTKFEPTQLKLNNLLSQSDTTLNSINTLLDDKTIADLKKSIADLSTTMNSLSKASVNLNNMLAENQENLKVTLQNANKMTANLAKVSDELAQAEFNKIVTDAQKMLTNLNNVLVNIESGNGSIGKLMKDESLYKNVKNASKQLELLLEDLRLNPKRYMHFSVFGKKHQPYQENEK
ncbi:ABC transporter substrate-binding protein [Capnocytophaga cynodegmi]|uniref:ABC transporter substrate-binding protein n=1 Tax=Capnocytophaga cynodegmi TaxID=28189 RepID=A0A250E761_9FLAO|nr:MlaD family protein [Capnocytophaga cynodegmi]ATA67588.1 ABC transporter substrate-binding protein [Capnocytophaga cynodegmi]